MLDSNNSTKDAQEKEVKKSYALKMESFSDYLLFVLSLGFVFGVLTLFLGDNLAYQSFLGMASGGVEGLLGVPQFYLNFKRQNTSGLS
jgi:hypothetical protein